MLGFGTPKCKQCEMELNPDQQSYEWRGKRFCCKDCKRSYRVGRKKGGGGSCH